MRGSGGPETDGASAEQTATQLVAELRRDLYHNEDAETAIEVYKTANWIIGQLEEVKELAIRLAQADLDQRSLDKLNTPTGSAGWTEPKATQLNEAAWNRELAQNAQLRAIQREYEAAKATLERAQEPYQELPAARFYIR